MANGNGVQAGLAAFTPQSTDAATLQSMQQPQQGPPAAGMTAMSTAAAPQPAAPSGGAPAPGSFGWKLARVLGGTMQALSSLGGPAVAAPAKAPAGAGGLFGAQSAAAEMQKENTARDVQRREQTRLDENQQIEAQKAKAYIAHENIATYHDQMLVWQQGDEATLKSAESGNMLMKAYTEPPSGIKGSEKFKDNVDGSELQTMLQQANQDQFKRTGKYLDPSQQHIFPTGTKDVIVGYDAQGQAQLRKRQTYTVVEDMPEVQLDAKQAAYISQFTDQKAVEGQKLPGYLYGTLAQQAKSSETAQVAIDDMRAQLGLKALSVADKEKMIQHYPAIGKALAQGGGDPFKTMATLENAQSGLGQSFIGFAFGDEKDPTGYLNAFKIEAEFRKEAFEMWAKTINLQPKLPWGNPALANDPKAYHDSMNPLHQHEVDAIYDGTAGLSKLDYFLTRAKQGDTDALAEVTTAHPDFNGEAVGNFVTLAKGYNTVQPGKEGFALNAMDTTMKHLHSFYDNTKESVLRPTSDAARKRNTDLAFIPGELDKSVNASSTIEGRRAIQDSLTPTAPWGRTVAVEEAAKKIMDKYDSYKNSWQSVAPNEKWANQMPNPFSPESLVSYVYITNKGQIPVAPTVTPAGVVGPGADGRGVAAVGAREEEIGTKRNPKDGKLHWIWTKDGGKTVLKDLGFAE